MPDGMLWFTSEMVPAKGTTAITKLIVSAPEVAVCLFEGAPVLAIYPETLANELRLICSLHEYCGVVTRHKAGTSYVQSEAYKTTLV